MNGELNTYLYADANPNLKIDIFGLKPYIFQWGVGGGIGYIIIGGSVFQLNVTDPIRGHTCRYTVFCFGLGVSLPEFGINSPPSTWDDGKHCGTCNQFSGTGSVGFASVTAGIGVSLGGWVDVPNGPLLTADGFNFDGGVFRIGTAISLCRFRYDGIY